MRHYTYRLLHKAHVLSTIFSLLKRFLPMKNIHRSDHNSGESQHRRPCNHSAVNYLIGLENLLGRDFVDRSLIINEFITVSAQEQIYPSKMSARSDVNDAEAHCSKLASKLSTSSALPVVTIEHGCESPHCLMMRYFLKQYRSAWTGVLLYVADPPSCPENWGMIDSETGWSRDCITPIQSQSLRLATSLVGKQELLTTDQIPSTTCSGLKRPILTTS